MVERNPAVCLWSLGVFMADSVWGVQAVKSVGKNYWTSDAVMIMSKHFHSSDSLARFRLWQANGRVIAN